MKAAVPQWCEWLSVARLQCFEKISWKKLDV